MLPIDIWPTWVMSLGVVVPLVATLAVCVCGCRKTVPKNELLGLDGVVKITNPEENLNHNHQASEINETTITLRSNTPVTETNDINRRPASANRSLPDIPIDSSRSQVESRLPLWEQEPNGDTSSELYATVGENKNVTLPLLARSVIQNDAAAASVQQDTAARVPERSLLPGDTFPPYATVKSEHPYDHLNSNEHPYAQVGSSTQNGNSRRSVELRHEEHVRNVASVPAAQIEGEPIPPPRTRRAVSLNPPASEQATHEIPAAPAIMGHIHANQDLPYMTPPIPGFSGDSQDSKGYTSISVREPLAKIKAQTKAANQRSRTQELADSHYTTVSDDSDEMYAAIEDPGMEYTSGSDTYAQIQTAAPENVSAPTSVVDVEEINPSGSAFPPQPPSVDSLRHVAQVHSRQASTSSATSSVINLGSPKPEKRQANSPLPPPPVGSPELRYSVPVTSLEEMYAKVMKKKHKSASQMETPTEVTAQPAQPVDANLQADTTSVNECVTQVESTGDRLTENRVALEDDKSSSELETISQVKTEIRSSGAVYERLPKRESFKGSEPGYESVGPNSLIMSYDPGYEIVHQVQRNPSDCDPNYEQLRPQHKSETHQYNTEYSEECDVNMKREYLSTKDGLQQSPNACTGYTIGSESEIVLNSEEPNYESMTSDTHEPNYAVVSGTSGGESDSAYEVVHQDDPNYESVNYFDISSTEPPYERLHNEEARDSDSETVSGYEKVKLQSNSSLSRSQNEQVSECVPQHNAEPGYEEVGHIPVNIIDDTISEMETGKSGTISSDIYAHVSKR